MSGFHEGPLGCPSGPLTFMTHFPYSTVEDMYSLFFEIAVPWPNLLLGVCHRLRLEIYRRALKCVPRGVRPVIPNLSNCRERESSLLTLKASGTCFCFLHRAPPGISVVDRAYIAFAQLSETTGARAQRNSGQIEPPRAKLMKGNKQE